MVVTSEPLAGCQAVEDTLDKREIIKIKFDLHH